ncbi:TetR/AcrR family transcriptional regulator [Streptomyces sp. NA13]|uniref:TetR/AcrR family transcriptional regulator n=1 Tax=Streptomyces sp. NA13 TaxID=2996051 RepID=UPI00227077F0|nr:TetR/AcrR family transcriptional regulator [Streptomyces sp. NA13]WAC97665.1 helix-turn-helix domain containing protein [Streptomyces sp. NA13]
MPEPTGRRERKKAATRQKIADAARRLFLERGYEEVGIREVAAEADVAVTTLFSHFPAKEALVFAEDVGFARRLTEAVTGRAPDTPLVPALRHEVEALVRHCSSDEAAPVYHLIDTTPALRQYEAAMRQRHADALATALAGARAGSATACSALATFTVDAYALARDADDPGAALDELFTMIEAAWAAAGPGRP